MNILEQYEKRAPSAQNALDMFRGEWSSKLPDGLGVSAGSLLLFEDARVDWAIAELGGVNDKTVLELAPLEGGHAYMLERHGARSIISIEANRRAFLKCLIVKEVLHLTRVQFLLGDFLKYLRTNNEVFDICFASGVLYHMTNPVELIQLLSKACKKLFIWTRYYEEAAFAGKPTHAKRFPTQSPSQREFAGFRHRLYRQEYGDALKCKGFLGGMDPFSNWMSKEEILACLEHFGFRHVRTAFEQRDHPNGPAFALIASRIGC